MKSTAHRHWNPRRLDVRALAQAGASLDGELSVTDFPRLNEGHPPGPSSNQSVRWQARGEMRTGASTTATVWMHLQVSATVSMTCQRCLSPVPVTLIVDRWFRFVDDEPTAEAEDDDCEEDVLALEPKPDLLALIEDELLMELPLVPMHETCPQPLARTDELPVDPAPAARPHPFEVLSRLKK